MDPSANLLFQYAGSGCPVDTGRDWTQEEITDVVKHGPHKMGLEPAAIEYVHKEVEGKMAFRFATIVQWDNIKHNSPNNTKVSPVSRVPHKSRDFHTILDLLFRICLSGFDIKSVNKKTVDMAPNHSLGQLGSVLPHIIRAVAESDYGGITISPENWISRMASGA